MVDWVTVASLATAADPMVLAVALYVPSGDMSFWQAAIREPDDPDRHVVAEVIEGRKHSLVVDLLYGDHEGGQRTISRFSVTPVAVTSPSGCVPSCGTGTSTDRTLDDMLRQDLTSPCRRANDI